MFERISDEVRIAGGLNVDEIDFPLQERFQTLGQSKKSLRRIHGPVAMEQNQKV